MPPLHPELPDGVARRSPPLPAASARPPRQSAGEEPAQDGPAAQEHRGFQPLSLSVPAAPRRRERCLLRGVAGRAPGALVQGVPEDLRQMQLPTLRELLDLLVAA